MVGASLDVESNTRAISGDILVETASPPRVELAVREDNVGGGEEVFVDVVATEEAKCPFVIWGQPELLLAESGV